MFSKKRDRHHKPFCIIKHETYLYPLIATKLQYSRRSASAYFQPNSMSSMSRESTLKSSQGSLGVFLSQVFDQNW